jgi:hypothetical protein
MKQSCIIWCKMDTAGGSHCLHLHDKLSVCFCWFVAWHSHQPWKWGRYDPLKHQAISKPNDNYNRSHYENIRFNSVRNVTKEYNKLITHFHVTVLLCSVKPWSDMQPLVDCGTYLVIKHPLQYISDGISYQMDIP